MRYSVGRLTEAESGMVVTGAGGGEMGSACSVGTEFPSGMVKKLGMEAMIITQHHECA